MKVSKLLLSLMFVFSSFLQANQNLDPEGDFYEVRGTVYARPDGDEITKLRAKLYLPPRGEGPLYIHLHDYSENESKTVQALHYFVEREYGRSVFYIVFPYKTADEIAIMRGSYMRDDDVALYSGEVFVAPADCGSNLPHGKLNFEHEDMRFIGMFSFKDRIIGDHHFIPQN